MKNQTAGTLEEKIDNRIDIYKELQSKFVQLLGNSGVIKALKKLREELSKRTDADNFEWKNDFVSDTKLLDSSLWALYDFVKNTEHEP